MDKIRKVGAVILKNNKLLVLKKMGLDLYISPGGKPENRETPMQTLKRELMEELGVKVKKSRLLGTFRGDSTFEDVPIEMITFLVEIDGVPRPQMEIEGMEWIDRDYKKKEIRLTSLLDKQIVPFLVKRGLL